MAESDFWQTLSDTIRSSVNLRIVTLVGDPVVEGTLERITVTMPTSPSRSLVTDINLVAGDITRIMSDKLLGPEYADLRNAHQEAVKQAQEIVARNISILTSVAKEIGERLGALPAPSSGPSRAAPNVLPTSTPVPSTPPGPTPSISPGPART